MVFILDRPASNVFYLSFWANLAIAIFLSIRWGIEEILGVNNAPSADAIPILVEEAGYWEGPFSTPIIAAAAANLPDGRILVWSAYARDRFTNPDWGDRGRTRTAILDPVTHTSSEELVVETNHGMESQLRKDQLFSHVNILAKTCSARERLTCRAM